MVVSTIVVVSPLSAPQRHRENRSGLEVDGMLGFVGQVRPTIFHLRDLRIGIVRVGPLFVGRLLLALPIKPRQSSRVGVSMPDSLARPVRKAS